MKNKKGHIGIVEKAKETSSDSGMHNRAITVLHGNNLIPISVPFMHVYLYTHNIIIVTFLAWIVCV